MTKIAVIGSGISGLSSAYELSKAGHEVSLFEANDYFGGHTHTVDVTLDGQSFGVDTGFLVFNHKTYPNLVRLFAELEIDTAATDMSFSVKMPLGSRTLEWGGADLSTVFAQNATCSIPVFCACCVTSSGSIAKPQTWHSIKTHKNFKLRWEHFSINTITARSSVAGICCPWRPVSGLARPRR